MSSLEQKINRAWYQNKSWINILYPLTLLYCSINWFRKSFYKWGFFKSYQPQIPVIIIGNIMVGGTGKTPTVLALFQFLKQSGFNPGIITRGYGGTSRDYPIVVNDRHLAVEVGDEALMLFRNTNAAVVVSPSRIQSSKKLESLGCDIIISDDGLQHIALKRDIEIVIFDGQRKLGNQKLLPTGPLRENIKRLDQVDFILINGEEKISVLQQWKFKSFRVKIKIDKLIDIASGNSSDLNKYAHKKVHALVAIGNPLRFIKTLKSANLEVIPHVFPDHHFYVQDDIPNDKLPIIVTEKDAVKLEKMGLEDIEYLKIHANFSESFKFQLLKKLHNHSKVSV